MEPVARPTENARPFVDALYGELLVRGIIYFLPDARVTVAGRAETSEARLVYREQTADRIEFDWLGSRYLLSADGVPLTEEQTRLLTAIGRVLAVRYHVVFDAELAARALHLFRGQIEDRYVSAFVDPAAQRDVERHPEASESVSDAIEVLRVSALTTYENRRIETGVLLFGRSPDPCHALPPRRPGALRYSTALTAIRTFHRLCDGLDTLLLVDRDGILADLIDIREWAAPYADLPLPVPTTPRYGAHARATLCGGHVCLVLTPNGEIKVFADGAEIFRFIDGRWRLVDAREKYAAWSDAVGDVEIAERLFAVALDLSEDRRGALFVVLDDVARAGELVPSEELLADGEPQPSPIESKRGLHYLLRGRTLLDLTASVLASVARIDGAIVLDRAGTLLSFGAIVRHGRPVRDDFAGEGGRTNAAVGASHYGSVLMVSEDGLVSFFRAGRRVWQL